MANRPRVDRDTDVVESGAADFGACGVSGWDQIIEIDMGHDLRAIIGRRTTIAAWAMNWPIARMVQLPQDFLLTPLTDQLHDNIVNLANVKKPDNWADFVFLSAGVESVLRSASRTGPIAYLETEYFGGIGAQVAVAWSNGDLLAGPFRTDTKWEDGKHIHIPAGEGAINKVLAALGVGTRGGLDQFDMLGLGKYRSMESALKQSLP